MSPDYPRLETPRLILRGFVSEDGPRVQQLAGDRAIAEMMCQIPHPYEDGVAEEWIATHRENFDSGEGVNLAVTLRSTGDLIGACGLIIRDVHKRAELGYWIGREYWGNGYATEAAKAVIQYAFSRGINRVFAEHYHVNPASGRVLQKAGMKHEGTLRQHMMKWDQPMDCEVYSILAGEQET